MCNAFFKESSSSKLLSESKDRYEILSYDNRCLPAQVAFREDSVIDDKRKQGRFSKEKKHFASPSLNIRRRSSRGQDSHLFDIANLLYFHFSFITGMQLYHLD